MDQGGREIVPEAEEFISGNLANNIKPTPSNTPLRGSSPASKMTSPKKVTPTVTRSSSSVSTAKKIPTNTPSGKQSTVYRSMPVKTVTPIARLEQNAAKQSLYTFSGLKKTTDTSKQVKKPAIATEFVLASSKTANVPLKPKPVPNRAKSPLASRVVVMKSPPVASPKTASPSKVSVPIVKSSKLNPRVQNIEPEKLKAENKTESEKKPHDLLLEEIAWLKTNLDKIKQSMSVDGGDNVQKDKLSAQIEFLLRENQSLTERVVKLEQNLEKERTERLELEAIVKKAP